MSATTPAPAPAAPTSKLGMILATIDAALKGLALLPVVGAPAGLADVFVEIVQKSMALYQAEKGQPLDLTQIPLEAPVP